jgi:hypothetical protein
MRVTDGELRRLYQDRATSADRSRCPVAGELAALAGGDLVDSERQRLLEHVAECASCALELKLAADVASAARVRPRSRPLLPTLALAATTLLVIGAGVWFATLQPGPTGDAVRGGGGVFPAPAVELAEPPTRLAWPPHAGATGYRVTIFDERAERLWQSPRLGGAQLDLPPEARAVLHPGATYLWLVEVEGQAARRELGPYRFTLSP